MCVYVLCNGEGCNLFLSADIIRDIKMASMRWAGYEA
jgi:hypothetical protein